MTHTSVILTGDINTKSTEWRGGGSISNNRGGVLSELLYKLVLHICNDGKIPPFRNTNGTSYIDLTICSTDLCARLKNCKVMEDEEPCSPHYYIYFELDEVHAKKHRH